MPSDSHRCTSQTWMPTMALSISPLIRFGTSSWTYQGWQGQVYTRQHSTSMFARECLGEYCQYQYQNEPLFRTVGNDSTFYRPPTANQLRRYLSLIPNDFEMCLKVWGEITIPRFAKHVRYGLQAGQPNPRFLDAQLFEQVVLGPCRKAQFTSYTGPFVFEFQRHDLSPDEFCFRLDQFFLQLPRDFRYAVEVRNPGMLGRRYLQVLASHGVAHVYTYWSGMPSLAEQHRLMPGFTGKFTVLRLLTPLKMSSAAAKKRAGPSTKIVEELPQMRQESVKLVRQAVSEGRQAYVLVHNRCEGNAPLTVQALVEMLKLA